METKTLKEAIHELRDTYKTESEKTLEVKIQELEKIITNLVDRVNYLESKCH